MNIKQPHMIQNKLLYRRLLGYVSPYLTIFLLAIVAALFAAAFEVGFIWTIKILLDDALIDQDPILIHWIPVIIFVVFLLRVCCNSASEVGMQSIAQRVVRDLRFAMFQSLLVLPCKRYDEITSSQLQARFIYDVTQVSSICTQGLLVMIRDGATVCYLLGLMLYLNTKLALLSLGVAPIIAILLRYAGRRIRLNAESYQQQFGTFTHTLDETIAAQKEVRLYSAKDMLLKRFHWVNSKLASLNVRMTITSEISGSSAQTVVVFVLACLIAFAISQSEAQELSVGSFVALFGAMAALLNPLKRLSKVNEQLQRGLAGAQTVFALIDEAPEPDQATQSLDRVQGEITLRNVMLQYQADQRPALQQINLHISAGQTLGIVGSSGSGKSSLISLLPRFYELSDGEILLDQTPIQQASLRSLRAQFAYVGQQIILLDDSIAANISLGQAVDLKTITAAAEQAGVMEFAAKLPQGLNTQVGENGARLSGGQRQRIAIARALLKQAPILLFDEATSALDADSERHIQQTLTSLQGKCTILIVAHRLSTIEHADQLIVLHNGEIIERGNHASLMAQNGFYAQLYGGNS